MSVSSSTFTRSADSHRRARSVALVPVATKFRMSSASACRIEAPSKASTGRNLMNSATFLSALVSVTSSLAP